MLDGEPERDDDDPPRCVACHFCNQMHGETSGRAVVSTVVITMLVVILDSDLPPIGVLTRMRHSLCDEHDDMLHAVCNLHGEPES